MPFVNCLLARAGEIGKLKLYYRPSTTPSVQKCNHVMKKSRINTYGEHPSRSTSYISLVTQHTRIYTQSLAIHHVDPALTYIFPLNC